MVEYIPSINLSFSDIISRLDRLKLNQHTLDVYNDGKELLQDCNIILDALKKQVELLERTTESCQEFINEIYDDLSKPFPSEDYVFNTAYGMLSYKGRDHIEKKNVTMVPERVLIPEINYKMKLTCVKRLSEIPSMFYYYKGDRNTAAGVYCNINNNCIRVPFPRVIDSIKDFNRIKSMRCKYKTRESCNFHTNRECNYAHRGENMIKIGYQSRCNSNPRFGNPDTIDADIKNISADDIDTILMYGLNDLFSSAVWFDYHKITKKKITSTDIA